MLDLSQWIVTFKSNHFFKSFMMWRLPRDAAPSSEYVAVPWKCLPSEAEIRKALTAQYRSTYRCDFMGMPQGRTSLSLQSRVYESVSEQTELTFRHSSMRVCPHRTIIFHIPLRLFSFCLCLTGCDRINSAERRLTPKHSRREVPPSTDTEMRDNYRQPRQKPELLPYRHDTASGVTCRGIGTVLL